LIPVFVSLIVVEVWVSLPENISYEKLILGIKEEQASWNLSYRWYSSL
jgi:hypothetical protein